MLNRIASRVSLIAAIAILCVPSLAQNAAPVQAKRPAIQPSIIPQSDIIDAMRPMGQSNRVTGAGGSVQLKGHIPAWITPSRQVVKAVDLSGPAHITVLLKRDPAVQTAFTQFLEDQQNPKSAYYHQWLTPQRLGELFGPTTSDIAAITAWLTEEGFKVKPSPSGVRIDAYGTIAKVGAALHTSFGYYSYNQKPRLSAVSDPIIPAGLAPVIQGIHGLTEMPVEPQLVKGKLVPAASKGAKPLISFTHGENYLAPGDFNVIYDLKPIYATGNIGGQIGSTPQRVAILGRSFVDPADIANFGQAFGLVPPGVTDIFPGDDIPFVNLNPGLTGDNDQLEATLDVERVIGTAPGASIDLVASLDFAADPGIEAAATYEVDTLLDPVMNISFGICEASSGAFGLGLDSGSQFVHFFDSIFSSAAAEGISSFVAAGDAGAAGCDTYFATPPSSQQASPNAVCASTYATCVGGTEFNDTPNLSLYWSPTNSAGGQISALGYIPEGAWNESIGTDSSGNPSYTATGGGGGTSSYIAEPSWQIASPSVPFNLFRNTPDLAFSSSGHNSYEVCAVFEGADCGNTNSSAYLPVEGTSAAAPGMAGIATLLNEAAGSRQGNLNPLIYRLANTTASAFHDVTVASSGVANCTESPSLCNNSDPGPSSPTVDGQPGYLVSPGYDLATGWGSLDAAIFIQAAIAPPAPTTLAVTYAATGGAAQPQTLTAVVSSIDVVSTPTGTVQFYIDGATQGMGPVTVGTNLDYFGVYGSAQPISTATTPGTATLTLGLGGEGTTHTITAVYSGDPSFQGSTAPSISATVPDSDYDFTAQVLTTSAPQVLPFGISSLTCGTSQSTCGVDMVASSYFTGPGASYFNVVGISGWAQGGVSLTVTFSPTIVPPAGKTLNATLNFTYNQCPANGNGPGSPCVTYGPFSIDVAGTVTGHLPVVPAQIQITPTQPVAIVAAPGATAVASGGNALDDLYVGFAGSFQFYSKGVWTTLVGSGTPGFDGVYGIPTTPGGPTNIPGSLVDGVYGIFNSYFSDSLNHEIQYPQYNPPANGLPAFYTIHDFIGLAYPASQCNELNLGKGGDQNFEFPGCTTVPSLPTAEEEFSSGSGFSEPSSLYIDFPTSIAYDGANYYFADTGSGTVDKLSGETLSILAGGANQDACGGYEIGMYGTTQCVIYFGVAGDGGLAFNAQINAPTSLAYSNGYLFIASDPTNLPYNPPLPASGNIRMVAGSNIITTPLFNGQPLTGTGLVTDSLGNLYITSKNPIQKVTFDANENPVSVTDWAPNPGGYSPAMSETGAIIVADGANINQIGNTGFVTLTSSGLLVPTTATATITNSGGSNLVLGAVGSITGPNAGDFYILPDGCSNTSIVSGGSCTYTFRYLPFTLGTETAQVTVASNVGTGSQIINLTGTVSALSLSTPVVPNAQDGTALSSPITSTATGGIPPYTFATSLTASSGTWSLTSSGANVSISGTPTVSGAIPFTITVTDHAGTQASVNGVLHAGTITLSQTGYCPYCPQVLITFGQAIFAAATTSASGGTAPYRFSMGSYPAGSGSWTISTPDGINAYVSLTPIATGGMPFSIDVMDANGATGSVTGILYVQPVGTTVQAEVQQQQEATETKLALNGLVSAAAFGGVVSNAPTPTGTVDFLLDGVDQNDPQTVVAGINPFPAVLDVDILFHTIAVTYSGDANYNQSSSATPVTVNGNRTQTITFPGNGLSIPENVQVALTAYASSGLPVTYAVVSGPGMLDTTGMNLIATGSGQIVVSAYQAGDQSFAPSNYAYANFIAQ